MFYLTNHPSKNTEYEHTFGPLSAYPPPPPHTPNIHLWVEEAGGANSDDWPSV
jgi:hypothetical protein